MRLICLISLFVATTALHAQVVYTVRDLGTLGGTISMGTSLNDAGQVAGSAYLEEDQTQNPFITDVNGGLPLRNLGTLGGSQAFGQAINDSGRVAGNSFVNDDPVAPVTHAFLSAADGGTLIDLGTLGGTNSYGYGVNGAGQVAGYSLTNNNSANHAFLSGSDGGPLKDLGTLVGGLQSFAAAVNASGQVTGYSNTTDEYQATVSHAFISDLDGGALHDLGTLGGSASFGISINDNGEVVGRSYLSSGEQHAFRSGPNGGVLFDLGSLGRASIAYDINNAGLVVGYSILSDNSTAHAFLYRTNFGMLDLNNLIAADSGWEVLINATAINSAGQITGEGRIDGETHAFLLTPIPPSARITAFGRALTGNFVVLGKGTPYLTYTVETTTSLTAGFSPVSTVVVAADGILRYEDSVGSGDSRRFYRFVYP